MAEALVSALVGTVIGNLNLAALQEIKLLWGLQDELERLESIFRTIQLVLQDAEVKQRNNKVLQNWLRKLKDAAYDADDVLDQIATAGLRRRWISERGKLGYLTILTSFFSKRNPLLFRIKIARKVKDTRGRLDALAVERLKFHLREGVMNNQVGLLESRQTSSLVNELEIFGRDEEMEMLVQKLLTDQDDLSVCAVWGMGGIGKTTLTQLVYNDERVEKHFELRIWVCVSVDFSLQRLIKAILESVQGGGCSVTELDPLLCLLQEKLRRKKFLLVLDDVWNENQSLWDPLKEALRCGSKGSGVMVTTRNEKIARMMATSEIMSHRIGYLSEADSWSLFKKRAFACRTEEENLVGIGGEIVKKCGGVPLAIKALGSFMRFKSHESEWLAVQESETWNLPDHGNNIFPILMLSYDNLSPQMRQCFSYCCVFPKDYWMDRDELIQLWMANGFLHEEGQKDLYLIGQFIFKELVWRSFLQDVEKHQIGKMRCKMHDLMHDLAESVMRQETYSLVDGNVQKIPPRVRHLSVDFESLEMIEMKRDKLQPLNVDTLHSLIQLAYSFSFKFLFSFLSNQQHLRVLDMRFFTAKELLKFVHKWEHLRFLSMSCIELTTLPESITRLHNLLTLKLIDTDELRKLPEGLKYMKNLWFVEIENHDSLICTPPGIGELTSLQRLSVFIVGEDSAHQISQLKELNLGGELSMRGLENVRNLEDVKAANMITKRNLESLNLSWTSGANKNSMEHFEATLEGIQPHHNLEKIHISSYQGSRFPNWMSSPAFINLSEINLESCEKCEHLPPLGKLPALKVLILIGFDSIRRLGGEFCGDGKSSFVALTNLSISEMPNLEEWIIPNSHESFLRLRYLGIDTCPKLIGLPFPHVIFNSLEELRFYECDSLRLFPAAILENMPSLISLSFRYCEKVDPLSGPLQRVVTSLHELEICKCPELKCLPESIQQLSALRTLTIQSCSGLCSLPDWIGNLQSLSTFILFDCPNLTSLPDGFGNLQSLSTFLLYSCLNLTSLPDGFGNLKSLSELQIRGCSPTLAKRCEKSKGEDWPKISHIPHLDVYE
ncbi:disease resistance protein RGA2-like [Primulina eburnea]|uniref:disease resistance protein RGA2-like n=1 Tax=Primulina eburnea TaxID=1245227 RepID=UPI003C6C3615